MAQFNLGDALITTDIDLSGLDKGLSQAESQTKSRFSSIGSTLGSTFKVAGAAAVAGMVTAGAAVAGFGALGLREFSGFQQGMNEVFTLMPGISQKSMGQMTQQVKDFSTEFGVLPKEVVPALYQSLSAGVPPNNVFEFLETAQKAAVGGVTDLTTAVDGISTVVNNYGADVIDAGKASDLMFTAVRLGKTNFEQLSSSIGNVLPFAAAAGVGFEDVSAAMAVMTAKTGQTAESSTKLRQLMVELADNTKGAGKTFEEVAGQSFKAFIAGGGNVQDALKLMEQAAKDNSLGIDQMFGSVEAGAAALLLTGENADSFSAALAEMGKSAGATDTAYQQMAQGLGFAFDKIKAAISVLLIDVGERLAPTFQQLADWLVANMPTISAAVIAAFDIISNVISFLATTILPILSAAFPVVMAAAQQAGEIISNVWQVASDIIAAVVPPIADIIKSVFGIIVNFLTSNSGQTQGVITGAWQTISGIIRALVPPIASIVTSIFGIIQGFLRAHGAEIAAVLRLAWQTIQQLIQVALVIIRNVVIPTLTIIASFISRHSSQIQAVLSAAWQVIRAVITTALKLIQGIISLVLAVIQGDWSGAWNAIKSILSTAWDGIKSIISAGVGLIRSIISLALSIISDTFRGTWNSIRDTVSNVVNSIADRVRSGLDSLVGFVRNLGSAFYNAGSAIINSLRDGIMNAFGRARDAVAGGLQSLRNLLPFSEPKDRSSPLYGLSKAGEGIMEQVQKGILSRPLVMPVTGAGMAAASATMSRMGITTVAQGSTVGATTIYNLTAQYKYQEERELKDDVRLLSMLHGGNNK